SADNTGSTTGHTWFIQVATTLSRRAMIVFAMRSVAAGSLYAAFWTTARIAASENFDTMRAAQKASSGRMLSKAALGYSGFHSSATKRSASNRPTERGARG